MQPSKPFAATIGGFVIPMTTGLLSACSSGLIIYIISRSQQKLSTTYHRIMAFMSFFDIISSLFIALGTIMMPSDTIYKFAGPMLGNKVTCQAQGWLSTFGLAGGTSLNACLAWYFVCRIVFKMQSSKIRNRIEPVMYIYTLIMALFVPSYYLLNDLIHPSLYDKICTITVYPESCDEEKWYDPNECLWDENTGEHWPVATSTTALHFILIVIGMSIILWTVLRTNKQNKNESRPFDENLEGNPSESMLEMLTPENSRVLLLQALMYIAGFFLTWIFNFVLLVFNVKNDAIDVLNCILFPLQGFWNLIIFLYDKTYLLRKGDKQYSLWQATKMLIASPSKAPVVFMSNINVVARNPQDCDNLAANEKSSNKGSGYDGESEVREAFGIPEDVEIHAPTNLDLPSIGSSMNPTVLPLHEIRGVQFLGNNNRRFFQSDNGIRRTGEMEDNRLGRIAHNSALSIETPKGFVGDSIAS